MASATGFLFVDREQSYIENLLYIHGRSKPLPYYDVPAKTWHVKMRLQKARPLGELRRKAVRGHNVRSKTLSVTQACHLSQSERLFEISIFRWDNVLL